MMAMFPLVRSRRSLAMMLTSGLMLSLALSAVMVLSVVGAAPASAHAVLVKITPLAGAELTTEPTEVVLEFDEPVNSTFATVVVSTARGVSVTRGKPAVLGGTVRQPLSPSMTSGVYRVAYRVVSNDGHPVSGESAFTLTLAPTAGSATPRSSSPVSSSFPPPTSAVATTAGPSAASPRPGQRGLSNRLLRPISGALALLASGGGVFLWRRRSR
jgi:copper resistance protein C